MSYADEVFIRNCRDILQNGVWDTDQAVRPRWEDDGAPAHTVKKFGIVNRYDLSREFPLLTLRRTYWKTAVDAATSGTSGPTRPAPSARPTAISSASGTSIPRANSTRWTACSTT